MESDGQARAIVQQAISLLKSDNPVDRAQAMEMLDSQEAFFAKNMAVPNVIEAYSKETVPEV